jgi:uncharacterized protein (DUF1330 family)
MPNTPRKPAGAAKGYIVATSWLHAETAFQKKLLLIKSWESAVPIITKFPQPPDFGAIVYGIDDDTAERAVAVANEHGWGIKLYKQEFSIRDVHIVDNSIVQAYLESVNERKDKYTAEHQPAAAAARKRARSDQSKHAAAAGDAAQNLTALLQPTAQKGPPEPTAAPPVGTPYVKPPGWGDEDGKLVPRDDDDTKPPHEAADPKATSSSQMQAQFDNLQSQVTQMQAELATLKAHVVELDRTIFDTKALVIQNIKVMPNETGPELTQKVKEIFQDLGFPITGIQSTKRMKGNTHLPVVIVTFVNEVAADLVFSNAKFFHPSAWTHITGGAEKIKQMTQMRGSVVGYCTTNRLRIRNDGYMQMTRFMKSFGNAKSSGRNSPPPHGGAQRKAW